MKQIKSTLTILLLRNDNDNNKQIYFDAFMFYINTKTIVQITLLDEYYTYKSVSKVNLWRKKL